MLPHIYFITWYNVLYRAWPGQGLSQAMILFYIHLGSQSSLAPNRRFAWWPILLRQLNHPHPNAPQSKKVSLVRLNWQSAWCPLHAHLVHLSSITRTRQRIARTRKSCMGQKGLKAPRNGWKPFKRFVQQCSRRKRQQLCRRCFSFEKSSRIHPSGRNSPRKKTFAIGKKPWAAAFAILWGLLLKLFQRLSRQHGFLTSSPKQQKQQKIVIQMATFLHHLVRNWLISLSKTPWRPWIWAMMIPSSMAWMLNWCFHFGNAKAVTSVTQACQSLWILKQRLRMKLLANSLMAQSTASVSPRQNGRWNGQVSKPANVFMKQSIR